ncbi:MAG: lipid-A-disaccharide synthase [Lentisphaeria bacterium]|nr:lipid-A-disaccharide synthase [Lentisphaeria bacterium]
MNKPRQYWILAGEASGDMYGARLARELQDIAAKENTPITLAGMGGPAMGNVAGFDRKVDSTELGVMGIIEVLKLLFTFIGIYFKLVKAALKARPDAVILIDYPGFNLMFALAMYLFKIPVIWYVCPHLWVWGKWRLPVLARICTKMLVIFPFEEEVFAPTPLQAEFVGHPLMDLMAEKMDPSIKRDPNCVLLLPGSRTMEITRLLPTMLETVRQLSKKHPELYYVLSTPREKILQLCTEFYEDARRKDPDFPEIKLVTGQTTRYQQEAGTGLAASGTVTVESAIAGLPLVVVYKLGALSILLASMLVTLYRGVFTMVNIILNRKLFPEFLQEQVTPENLVPAMEEILPNGPRRTEVEDGMREMTRLLAPKSASAIRQAAEHCWQVHY